MAKKPNMQAALMEQETPVVHKAPAPSNDKPIDTKGRSPSRIGKKQIGAWLHPDFDRSMLLVLARSETGMGKQDLIAEALNDLFRKHNVPTVNQK